MAMATASTGIHYFVVLVKIADGPAVGDYIAVKTPILS